MRPARTLLASVAVLAVACVAVPSAEATQPLRAAGRIGSVVVPQGTCDVRPLRASHSLMLTAPAIYARDRRRGRGNDVASVRWYTVLTDATGAPLQAHPWSAWSRATDIRPAPYAGQQAFFNLNRYNSAFAQFIAHGLDVVVVWHDRRGRRTGSATYRVTSFRVVEGEIEYVAGNCA
jgi:hypothetical protein